MKKALVSITLLTSIFIFSQVEKDSTKTKTIEAVTLSGKKPLVERKVDRLVYNVQNSMLSQGSSGIEILTNTPLLKVDEEKGVLSMVGKSGLSVMVNDRILNLSGDELINYIKNLRSENIAKIEVITTPPAKYEAQGNSGIINIVLKKNQKLDWSGYLNSYYKQSTYAGFGGGGAINFQNEKLKSSFKLRGSDEEKKSVENYQIIGNSSTYSRNERRDMNDGLGGNASLEYTLSSKATLGAVYDFSKMHSNMDISTIDHYYTLDQNTLNNNTDSKHRSTIESQMLNLYYDQKLGEHKLSIGANYYGTNPIKIVNFATIDLEDQSIQTVRNLSTLDYKVASGQADLTLNFKNIQVETGAKYSQFSNDSDIQYLNLEDKAYFVDPSRSNLFNYDEKNYATYASASKQFGEKWSVKVGLRYEYAETTGFSPNSNSKTETNYGKLFPTAYISYKMNTDNQFSLNYSKRINRPNFRALDPFRWYSSPYSYFSGNPLIQPSFNHNLELNYIFKNKLSANMYFQRTLNSFEQITKLDGIYSVSTYQNYFNLNTYGIDLNYTDTFFKFWETNNSASMSYTEMEVTKYNASPKNGNSYYFSTNNTFQLNRAKTFYLFVNYWQSLPSTSGNTISKSNRNLSAGIKTSFLDKSLQINVSINDIFKQSGWRGSVYFEDNIQIYNNYWDARKLTLSVTYNFGIKKLKSSNKNIDFKDVNRAQ